MNDAFLVGFAQADADLKHRGAQLVRRQRARIPQHREHVPSGQKLHHDIRLARMERAAVEHLGHVAAQLRGQPRLTQEPL